MLTAQNSLPTKRPLVDCGRLYKETRPFQVLTQNGKVCVFVWEDLHFSPQSIERKCMLYDPLTFDYESLRSQRVNAIQGTRVRRDRDGFTICDEVALALQETSLLVSVSPDTDENILQLAKDVGSLTEASSTWTTPEPLNEHVGRELGWCWVGRNYLGYADVFVLSFSGIEPEIALWGIASCLRIYKIRRV